MKTKSFLLLLVALNSVIVYAQELSLVREDGKFGYIDKTGKYAIQPSFEEAKTFSNGLAAAVQDKKWGYIKPSGEWAIEPKYEKVKYFDSGYAMVAENGEWKYI